MNGILVSGLIRSGTTWVGHVLATAKNTIYIHEPFNPDSNWSACFPLPSHMVYISSESGGIYFGPFSKILKLEPLFRGIWRKQVAKSTYHYIEKRTKGNKENIIPIIKDPIAIFSIEWLVNTHHLKPIILLRHPISIVKSIIRLGWTKGNVLMTFANQQFLVERFYSEQDQKALYENMENWKNLDIVKKTCLFVRYMYLSIVRYIQEYPEWLYICYEDIANNPEKLFNELMNKMGLEKTAFTIKSIDNSRTARYGSGKAHQSSSKPIPYDIEHLLRADDYSNNWEDLYNTYFYDISQVVEKYVSWND